MVGGYQLMTSKHTGAFFGSDYGTADYHGQDGRQNVPTTFGIDASRSSAVYGRSSTVQPASTLMHRISLREAGCTVWEDPYTPFELDASK